MPAAITMPITTAADAISRGSPSGALLEIWSSALTGTFLKPANVPGR